MMLKKLLLGLMLALMPRVVQAGTCTYHFVQTPAYLANYYVVNDTNPTTSVFNTITAAYVANTDTTFRTWLSSNEPCTTAIVQGAANNGSGLVRLTVDTTGSLRTGQAWQVTGTAAYDGTWVITVIDGAHLDLQGSTYSSSVSSGSVQGPNVVATDVALRALINSFALASYNASGSHSQILNTSTSTTVLTNPVASTLQVNPHATGDIVQLPASNQVSSMPIGVTYTVKNIGTLSFVLQDNGGNTLGNILPNQTLSVWSTSNSTTIGTFGSAGPFFNALPLLPQGRLTFSSHQPVIPAPGVGTAAGIYYDCSAAGTLVPYNNGGLDLNDIIGAQQGTVCEVGTGIGAGVTNANDVFDVFYVGGTSHTICVATNGSGAGWSGDSTTDTSHTANTHTNTVIDGISPNNIGNVGWQVGDTITGSGIPGGATITSIIPLAATITISAPTTSSLTATPLSVKGGTAVLRGFGYSQIDAATHPYQTNKNAIANCYGTPSGSLINVGTIAAGQGTYLGTFATTGTAGQSSFNYGANATGGNQTAKFLLWNAYNRVNVTTSIADGTTNWTYTGSTVRPANNTTANSIQFVTGRAEDGFTTSYSNSGSIIGTVFQGLALDSSTAFDRYSLLVNGNAVAVTVPMMLETGYGPQVGVHNVYALEASDGSHVATFSGSSGMSLVINLRM